VVHIDAAKGEVIGKMNLNVSCAWNKPPNENNLPVETFIDVPVETFGENAINSASYRVIAFPAESPIHPGVRLHWYLTHGILLAQVMMLQH
jgi:hypothetical protein